VAQPISMDIEIDDPFPTDDNDLDTFFIWLLPHDKLAELGSFSM
jgi:hypothetical protein